MQQPGAAPVPPREIKGPTPEAAALEQAKSKEALNKEPAAEAPAPQETRPVQKPADKPPADERRHFFRFAVDCPVEVVENIGHTREYVREAGNTLNLSGGGMLAEFASPLPPGSYRFRIHLPGDPMILPGRVIKKGDGPVGRVAAIEFTELNEGQRSKLIRFIFNMMRNLKDSVPRVEPNAEGEEGSHSRPREQVDRSKERRERFFKPSKIRYW